MEEQVNGDSIPTDPAAFLTQVGEDLASDTQWDKQLLTILQTHFLVAAPAAAAVDNALEEIETMARERASLKTESEP